MVCEDSARFNTELSLNLQDPTIEDTDRVKVTIDGEEYTVQIMYWGSVDDATAVELFYKTGIHGVYLVYSVVSANALDDVKNYIEKIQKWKEAANFPLLIAGNKIDLPQWRIIRPEDGQALADQYNALFFETSAKNGTNVHEAFMALIKRIVEVHKYKTRVNKKSKRECSVM